MLNSASAILATILYSIAQRGNCSLFELFIVCSISFISSNVYDIKEILKKNK